jgi:hypothetical protein
MVSQIKFDNIFSKIQPLHNINTEIIKVFFKEHGDKEIARDFDGLELIQEAEKPDNTLSIDDVKDALADVLQRYADFTVMIPLGDKWTGGKLVMQPGNPDLKSKEVPIEVFFHKIVMLRDRLRVLEQNINSNNKLTDEDKVKMQQYITRVYGSLTTFNILFKEERHQFKGEGGKD